MTDTGRSWARFVPLAFGLLILLVLLLTPVHGWLNRIPNLWEVLYPLLTVFGAYLLITGVRRREGPVALVKWSVLLAAALSATLYAYGATRIFFFFSHCFARLLVLTVDM